MALLRVALLCHLFVSVAGADRKATNVVCLADEPGQVYLSFAGASAMHSVPRRDFPQADALSVAQARACCTTTWEGAMSQLTQCRSCQVARVRIKATSARRKWVRWPESTQSPRGSACLTVHLVARAQS